MSLALALTAVDGLVLAADSRITEGYTLDGPKTRDNSIKFLQLGDSWGVLTYGNAVIGNQAILSLQQKTAQDGTGLESLQSLIRAGKEIFEQTSLEWGLQNPGIERRDKDVGFILGGYDRETAAFRTLSLQSPRFEPKDIRSGCLLGGQWHISKFFMSKINWKGLDVERMKTLVVMLFDVTMAVDIQVGGPIRLATVTANGSFQWIAEREIEVLKGKCISLYGTLWEHCCSDLVRLRSGYVE